MQRTLNPKLTKRMALPLDSDEVSENVSKEGSSETKPEEEEVANPNAHLMHNGSWLVKEV